MRDLRNIIGISAVLLLCLSCGNSEADFSIIPSVKTDTATTFSTGEKSCFTGKIRSDAEVGLSFRVAGTIEKIFYPQGAFVKRGSVIAQLDSRDYQFQLSATEAEYQQIKSVTDRVTELYNRGSATQNDYEKAKYGLQQITAKYNVHKKQLADTRLYATTDGYVRKILYNAGETIAAGMPVISLTSSKECLIDVDLPLTDYAKKDDFESFWAILNTDNFSTANIVSIPLKMKEIAAQANANGLYRAVFSLPNTDTVLITEGMTAEVCIKYAIPKDNRLYIPVSALFEKDKQSYVWVYNSDNQTVNSKSIQIGNITQEGKVVVLNGLQKGEIIVSAGVHSIREGMKVKPIE
ncbi:MAG: efflux RND transporter periplasmic adaptor subunit [Bacteroidales bacterium]|jgi:RND family efflux transporter MFP subunit|nr:efflux RND transporter periplasmic adaptor subunit [Bacteroidales bacterium]